MHLALLHYRRLPCRTSTPDGSCRATHGNTHRSILLRLQVRWPGADVDLFLYGLGEEAAAAKLQQLVRFLWRSVGRGQPVAFVRSPNTLTVDAGKPKRPVQAGAANRS